MSGWQRWMWVVAVLVLVSACSRSVYHRVRPGENLFRISKAYGVSVADLARENGIENPSRIEVGQELRIPGAKRSLPVGLVTPKEANANRPAAADLPKGTGEFAWPVEGGTLSSNFGPRGDSFHDGIDISAPAGTPVKAAGAGEVVYSDVLRGYGKVIIVRHANRYATVYAHNERNLAETGQYVRRGETIAEVGDTGRTTGSNLHFEVRMDNVARNPLFFLPASQVAEPRRFTGVGG